MKDGFAQVKNGEVWFSNVHIAPYEEGNIWNQDPDRRRKLLLHKKANPKAGPRNQRNRNDLGAFKGLSQGWLCQIAFGTRQRKHDYDKRESIKRREQNRDIARVMKQYNTLKKKDSFETCFRSAFYWRWALLFPTCKRGFFCMIKGSERKKEKQHDTKIDCLQTHAYLD